MKRIHLFEFEDFPWFPGWLRVCMTRYIVTVHGLLGTAEKLAQLLARALPHASAPRVIDLCSGGGGPMPAVQKLLASEHGLGDVSFTLTDLYPNLDAANEIARTGTPGLTYRTTPVDATQLGSELAGARTMDCSLHHMRPQLARKILADAQHSRQPFCAYEISDNSPPAWLWWLAIPVNFLVVLLLTPFVRPFRWQQFVFTYLIPLLPLFIAWDGSVSNVRTYTLADMEELVADLQGPGYMWETGALEGRAGKKLYLLGIPQPAAATPA